jgi:hypothetical protein
VDVGAEAAVAAAAADGASNSDVDGAVLAVVGNTVAGWSAQAESTTASAVASQVAACVLGRPRMLGLA